MDGGAWCATVHGVAKSRTQLSNFTSLHFCAYTPASLGDCELFKVQLLVFLSFPSVSAIVRGSTLTETAHPGQAP